MRIVELSGTTDASGDLTMRETKNVVGYVEKVVYVYDDGANHATLALTSEYAISEEILTDSNLEQTDIVWYPRVNAVDGADAAAFTNENAAKYFVTGDFKVVIADGGNSKNFKFLIYLSDE